MHPMHTAEIMSEALSRGQKNDPNTAVEYLTSDKDLTVPDVINYLEEAMSRGYTIVTLPWAGKKRLVALREFHLTDLVKEPRSEPLTP